MQGSCLPWGRYLGSVHKILPIICSDLFILVSGFKTALLLKNYRFRLVAVTRHNLALSFFVQITYLGMYLLTLSVHLVDTEKNPAYHLNV
jgi:hypothetical protein